MSELPTDEPSIPVAGADLGERKAAAHEARMKRAGAKSLENLPLFATDDVLGAALLGADRVQEWRQIVSLLETRGLPKIDKLMGGRYVPAVVAYFDHQYALDRGCHPPLAPDGAEDFEKWKKQKRRS
jgi:hypothetical protein